MIAATVSTQPRIVYPAESPNVKIGDEAPDFEAETIEDFRPLLEKKGHTFSGPAPCEGASVLGDVIDAINAADRRFHLLSDLVDHLGRSRARLGDVDVGRRKVDVRVVGDLHRRERVDAREQQRDEKDDRGDRVADAPGRNVPETHMPDNPA